MATRCDGYALGVVARSALSRAPGKGKGAVGRLDRRVELMGALSGWASSSANKTTTSPSSEPQRAIPWDNRGSVEVLARGAVLRQAIITNINPSSVRAERASGSRWLPQRRRRRM
eukprot:2265189-Prymnesium_polylepis.1